MSFILLYVYFNPFAVNVTQFNPRVAKLYSINFLSIYFDSADLRSIRAKIVTCRKVEQGCELF